MYGGNSGRIHFSVIPSKEENGQDMICFTHIERHTASSDSSDSSDSSEGTESECSSVEYSERDDYDYSNNGGCNNGDYDCMCDTCMVFAMQSIYINGEWVDRTPDNSTFVNGTWIAI